MKRFVFTKDEFERIQKQISTNLRIEKISSFYDKLFTEKIEEQIEYLHKHGLEELCKLN